MTTKEKGRLFMKETKPIRDMETVKELLDVYERGSKNFLIIAYALNTGLRVSDILKTKVGTAKRGYWTGHEQKTGKYKDMQFSNDLKILVIEFAEANGLADDDWLFFNDRNPEKAISRQAVDKVIRNAGEMVGIVPLSAHSLRKTFGYMAYNSGEYDISELQFIFNHSAPSVTLNYIGVSQEIINEKNKNFSIGI